MGGSTGFLNAKNGVRVGYFTSQDVSGLVGMSFHLDDSNSAGVMLEADEARELGAALIRMADEADRLAKEKAPA